MCGRSGLFPVTVPIKARSDEKTPERQTECQVSVKERNKSPQVRKELVRYNFKLTKLQSHYKFLAPNVKKKYE